ncbi:MAG: helix-turn-helix domain-containing protein [Rubrivivax sp.]|jgi:AraC-like DNA-binding protein|nr:helix-turn-helix domain-containing protein [Rubrivivax sp.]
MSSPPLLHAAASLRRYAGEYAAHAHDHAQLLLGLRGGLQLEAAGHAALVEAGTAIVVPAGVAHAYRADRPSNVLVIDAPMRRGLERMRRLVPPPAFRDALAAGALPDAEATLQALIGAPTAGPRRRLDLEALQATLRGRLHEAWGTAQLAALVHLSPQRFHARFVEATGRAPAGWLRALRLDESERLLAAGVSLEAAALYVGYASASALGHALRRDRGSGARKLRPR